MHENQKIKINRDNIHKLLGVFKYVLPYKRKLLLSLIITFISSAAFMVFPKLVQELIDNALGEGSRLLDNINQVVFFMFLVSVFMGVLAYINIILLTQINENTLGAIRTNLYQKILTLPIFYFERHRVGDVISRITNDVTQLHEILSWRLVDFFRQTFIFSVSLIYILYTNFRLSMLMILSFPFIIVCMIYLGRYIKQFSKKTQASLSNANIVVEETLQAIDMVKAFNSEFFESKRYTRHIYQAIQRALVAAKYRGAMMFVAIFGMLSSMILVLWYGMYMVEKNQISIGDLVAFIILTALIGAAINQMMDAYSVLQRALGASVRIIDVFEQPKEYTKTTTEGEVLPSNITGDIIFERVSFYYPMRPDIKVLDAISFKIKQGDKIALVGKSGSGKSTIIKLLLKYYDTKSVSIKINNKPIDAIDTHTLRSSIGIVPQEVVLFGESILENIKYGNTSASESEIIDALKQANAWSFVQNFPEGVHTLVGERGIQLSGGQKQRIAIARAILKNPSILILDEATSALDAESEYLVQQALDRLMQNRTTIIIAHRLSTIKRVDNILVLENGILLEQGTHNTLNNKDNGAYKRLLSLQMQA